LASSSGPTITSAMPHQQADSPWRPNPSRTVRTAARTTSPNASRVLLDSRDGGRPGATPDSAFEERSAKTRARAPPTSVSQVASQTKPSDPMATNAIRQPRKAASGGTLSGVRIAPTAAPELKIPFPRLRSFGGRTVAVTRNAQGQLNDSPTPSRARKTISAPSTGA